MTYDELACMEDEGPHYAFYQDANGNQFHSYEEACHYYGVDTPAQLAAEEAWWDAQEEVWVAATPEWPRMEAPPEFACPF